jgi:23S rRNA (uridine2552-2'-O)-methyltransferase
MGYVARMTRRFVAERHRDRFYRAAQAEGLRSRAAFKLDHLADRFPIFRPGDRVLDLGAAPGGWSLVALERAGPSGRVVAVDPRAVDPIPGARVIHRSVGDPALPAMLAGEPFDVVLSDMSPRISGAYATDHARSIALASAAFDLARSVLAPGGRWVAKVFDGDLLPPFEREIRSEFDRFLRTKPPASRPQSSELYLLGLGFRPAARVGRTP